MEQNTVGIPQTGAKTAAEIKVTTTDHRTRDFSIGRSRGGEAGSWGHMGPMWPVWPQKGQLCLQRNSDGKEGTWAASLRFLVCIESGGDGTIPTSWDFEGWERAIMRVKVFCKLWNVHFFFFFLTGDGRAGAHFILKTGNHMKAMGTYCLLCYEIRCRKYFPYFQRPC